jgi:iron-regulated transporter 1
VAENQLTEAKRVVSAPRKASVVESIVSGWRDFRRQPAALSMAAYALLWLTILSPHGVLLAAWLKTEWGMSEAAIGIFRGLGAVFGLAATLVFPRVLRRFGLVGAARLFIIAEAICLIGAGLALYLGKPFFTLFAALILFSRIGLYGFSLGETEIRQVTIAPSVRGRVNGFASALTSLATLGVYGAGTLLGDAAEYPLLVYGSVAFVCCGALVFTFWSSLPAAREEALAPFSRRA